MDKYDRVDVPENLYLHSDGEAEDFGTGVYPISVISRKSNFKNDTVKVACFKMRRKSRTLLILGSLAFLVVLILIIVIAKVHKNESEQKQTPDTSMKKEDKTRGLIMEPSVDHIPFISYTVTNIRTYAKYLDQLQYHVSPYQAIAQQTHSYVNCQNESAPDGKACRLTDHDFGTHCTHTNLYGYNQARPCVLLMLKLDDNAMIDPFTSSDSEVKKKLGDRWAEDHVGITCDGETDLDKKYLGNDDFYGKDEHPITYNPPTGFPVWFYPKKNRNYKVPAVMIHFNSIRTYHLVTVKCTAWAKSFNGGKPQDSPVYSTRFQFYIK